MVTEDDLIRTVAAAYWQRLAAGEAVLHVRAADRDRRGRAADRRHGAQGHPDRPRGHRAQATSAARCRSAGSCPSRTPRSSGRPSCAARDSTRRLRKLRGAMRADKKSAGPSASATTTASRGMVEGLLSRGDRRVGTVIGEVVARTAAGSTAGASTSPTSAGWPRAERRWRHERSTWTGTPPASATATRCCPGTTWTPAWTSDWLWEDWQDALREVEVEDCRWTPCFDCGVCPPMGTEIQIGPTGGSCCRLAQSCSRC